MSGRPGDRTPTASVVDPRVRLAAERTLLAWIRTGLAMMGFGFVVARFALWLRALPMTATGEPVPTHHLSVWFGTALVLLGVATNAIAARRHRRYLHALDAGDTDPNLNASLPITIANLLAAVGIAMAGYLAFEIM
jgi:putative membrane protein